MSIDAATALRRAIRLALAGFPGFILEEIKSRSWASATFTGARHELRLRLEGEGAEAAAASFLSGLEAAEFPMRGHLLADIALLFDERTEAAEGMLVRIGLEALTVEDG